MARGVHSGIEQCVCNATQALLQKYFALLPLYQGVPLETLKLKRVLFGAFPCYADAPLQPQFDRVLQVPYPQSHAYILARSFSS